MIASNLVLLVLAAAALPSSTCLRVPMPRCARRSGVPLASLGVPSANDGARPGAELPRSLITPDDRTALEEVYAISSTEASMLAAELVLETAAEETMARAEQWRRQLQPQQDEEQQSALSAGVDAARAVVALVALVYGTNYATVKLLDEQIGTTSLGALLRFSICACAITPALLMVGSRQPKVLQRSMVASGLEIGVWMGLGYIVQAMALETSAAATQAFLLSLTVIVCPFLETALDGVRQPARVWFAAGLSVVGVALLEASNLLTSGGCAPGDVLGLLQPVFFGVGFYRLESAMGAHVREGSCAPEPPLSSGDVALALTTYQTWTVLVMAFGWAMLDSGSIGALMSNVVEASALAAASPAMIGALLWCGIVTTAGCSFAEAQALSRLSASDAMVIFATEPLWAAAFAWCTLGETMGPAAIGGGGLIVLSCVLSSGAGLPPDDQPSHPDHGAGRRSDARDYTSDTVPALLAVSDDGVDGRC